MFFPIGDDNVQKGSKPVIAYLLIVVNVIIFLFEFSLGANKQAAFIEHFGCIPTEILHGIDYYTIITSMFLHGGWMHLIGNMMFLWVFADNIEATIGSFKFFLFYLIGGVVAALFQALLSPNSHTPCVGASGAIAACLGAYIIMFPQSKIKMIFLPFFITFGVSAIYFLGFWIIQQLFSGFGSLATSTADVGGVAYWAHIGGFIYGLILGKFFKNKVLQNTTV